MGDRWQLHEPSRPSPAPNGSRHLARPAALYLFSARGVAVGPELWARAGRPWARLSRAVRSVVPHGLGLELQDAQPRAPRAAHVQPASRYSGHHLAIAARGEAVREQPALLT